MESFKAATKPYDDARETLYEATKFYEVPGASNYFLSRLITYPFRTQARHNRPLLSPHLFIQCTFLHLQVK
jgi:hypothetical protein